MSKTTILSLLFVIVVMTWCTSKNQNTALTPLPTGDNEIIDEIINDTDAIWTVVEEENDIEDTTILTGTTVSNTPGIYIDGNTSTIDTFINQGKKVIAYFHADRCPTCQALEKDIQLHINNIPSDIAIVKFNYDKEEELKIKYKVQAQNTIVYLAKDKTELASKVGWIVTLDEIIKNMP